MADPTLALARQVGSLLLQQDGVLATAESCTGGGVAYAITQIPGCSAWFEVGWVTYRHSAKVNQLGLDAHKLVTNGAVSRDTATQMAQQALEHSFANWSLAVTGIAGPSAQNPENPQEKNPVGSIWFAVAHTDGNTLALHTNLAGTRAAIRKQAINIALAMLVFILKHENCNEEAIQTYFNEHLPF